MYIITSSIIYYLPEYSYTDYSWRIQVDLKVSEFKSKTLHTTMPI